MPNYDLPRPSQESVLRLECWYHGMLTRVRAESLVQAEGDFLVRDSISSKDDFVLTVFWGGRAIHFQINREFQSRDSANCFFQFEEEQFENITDLIIFYQSHRKPITRSSGCIISNPVPNNIATIHPFDNTAPQQEIEQNYMKIFRPQFFKDAERTLSQRVLLNEARKQLQLRTAQKSAAQDCHEPSKNNGIKHLALSALLNRPLPQPTPSPIQEDQDEYCEMDYDAMDDEAAAAVSARIVPGTDVLDACVSLPRVDRCARRTSCASLNTIPTSASMLSAGSIQQISRSCQDVSRLNWRLSRAGSAPALPKRAGKQIAPLAPVRDSGCVADDHNDYDQPRAQPSHEYACTSASVIDVGAYKPNFFGDECTNEQYTRAQAPQLVLKFRSLLLENSSDKCAELITVDDCRLFRICINYPKVMRQNPTRQLSGLSLLLSPHEVNIRNDLIERSQSLYFLCILTILHQPNLKSQRIVYQAWIAIAHSLIYSFGNAFSFLSLMSALSSDALKKQKLRTNCTELESLLIPLAKIIQLSKPLPPNGPKILLPFVQPLLNLLSNTPSSNFLDSNGSISMQIECLWQWLEAGRRWSQNANRIAESLAQRFASKLTIRTTENFLCTEFSLRFLFGMNGANVEARKRYEKLAMLVDVLGDRCALESDC